MTQYLVDLTIAVHSGTRPIARAVASVLDHTNAAVRVNVVAHNIDPQIIRENLGRFATDPRVRLLELRDGIPSPAGPMNHGFASSTAPFLSLMGSDDELAPGAIDSWLALQSQTNADVVLARIQLANGRTDPYPPVRWSLRGARQRRLDGRKDRLAYRSAPLGLISRERFGDLRLSEGLASGEDLAYTLTLWFDGANIAYDLAGPAYVENADASDRVTADPRSVARDFAFLPEIEAASWFVGTTRAERTAIVLKLVRIHFFDAVLARSSSDEQLAEHRNDLVNLLAQFDRIAPGYSRLLSRADCTVFSTLRDGAAQAEHVRTALTARHTYLSPATLITRNPLLALHAQGPFRTLFAGYQVMRKFYGIRGPHAFAEPTL